MNKSRLSNIFGLKLLPVSGEMTSTAKDMLDQEIEYIDYLRSRKKFFFMTQVQQTRVHVRKKKKCRPVPKDQTPGGRGFWRRRRKVKSKVKVKKKVPLKQLVKQKARIKGQQLNKRAYTAANKISAFTRKKALNFVQTGARIKSSAANSIKSTQGLLRPKKLINNLLSNKGPRTLVRELVEAGTEKAVKKQVTKQVAKKLAVKTAVKVGLKKIPVVSLIAGLGFGLERLVKGDFSGAALELASGVASSFPGPGTALSTAIDAALIGKDITGMKDGGEVSSPTQALIAEGGEPELVVPHSKLGPVFQSLLKQVGTILTDVTTGFLSTLPVPTSASAAVSGESAKLAAVFGGKSTPLSVFKGSKIASAAKAFLKKAAGGAMGLAKSAFSMTPAGMVMGMFNQPAKSETLTTTKTSKISIVNGVVVEDSSFDSADATSIGNFPITDVYGSTENRSKPHGGVDIGTPVGTPVGFNEPGQILAAGKFGGYGNLMDVWLPQSKIQMRIAHLSKFIKKTGKFIQGEKLAETGGAVGDPGAGSSTGPHLHFEYDIKKDSTRYGGAGDPMPYAPLINLSAVEAPSGSGSGGPSLAASYGHPLQYTVKWPSSGGSMGGPSLMPNQGGVTTTGMKTPTLVPIPFAVQTPVPVPVQKIIMRDKTHVKSYGIDSFSGKYGEL